MSMVSYGVGRKQGRLDEKLSANRGQIVQQDSVTKRHSARADTSRKEVYSLDKHHDSVRVMVEVAHDSVFVRDTVYVNSDIASLIVADDSLIAAQKRSLALQDTLIASLRKSVELRDTRIHLLESEVTPGKLKRFINATRWVAVGAVVGLAVAHR